MLVLLSLGAFTKRKCVKVLLAKLVTIFSILHICVVMTVELFSVSNRIQTPTDEPLSCFAGKFSLQSYTRWFGHKQTTTLVTSTLPYISYIIVLSLFCIMQLWLKNRRASCDESAPKVVFENVNRKNADESLSNLLKFLINYGFYQFGVEITLIAYVIVIFAKADLISLFYMLWFPFMIFPSRTKSEKLWRVTAALVMSSILLQSVYLGAKVIITFCNELLVGSLESQVNIEVLTGEFLLLMLLSSQVRKLSKFPLRPAV